MSQYVPVNLRNQAALVSGGPSGETLPNKGNRSVYLLTLQLIDIIEYNFVNWHC
jgi:hypothetical protein